MIKKNFSYKQSSVIYLFILLLSSDISFGQNENQITEIQRQILTSAAEMPQFPGGALALRNYLIRNLRYPKKAYKEKVEGKVVAKIVVEPDGSLGDIEIVKKLSPECDAETIRVIKKMPKWNPAMQDGLPVACYYNLPITFRLK